MFFRCLLLVLVISCVGGCSLWRRWRCCCCCWRRGDPGGGSCDDEASSERESAGSCYPPPQYSRCSSFHHAPPPYTEVKYAVTCNTSSPVAAGPIAQLHNEPPTFFKIKRVSSNVLMQSYIHYHFCEFSTVYHQIRWDANKLFSLHPYLNEACLKLFERSKILK